MSAFLNHNDRIFRTEDSLFAAANRGFRYGDGLFESIRVVQEKIRFLPQHVQRLQEGMAALKLTAIGWDVAFWQSRIEDLMRRNKCYSGARVRITVYRETGGFYTPESNNASFLIELEALEGNYQLNEKGIRLGIAQDVVKPYSFLSSYKTCNALPYVLAGISAQEQGVDDCLILNPHQRIVEGVKSNIFFVKSDKVYTPALQEGCINGVMRRMLLQLMRESAIPVMETSLEVGHLLEADEVFFTNAVQGIQWVIAYEKQRYFNVFSARLIQALQAFEG